MDSYQFPKEEVTKAESKRPNKTILILIVLIIISAITLGFVLANQKEDTASNSTEQPTETQNNESDPPRGVKKENEIPVPEIKITKAQLEENSTIGSCWTIIDGSVYDITSSLRRGSKFVSQDLLDVCGKDGTKLIKEGVDGRPPLANKGPFDFYAFPQGKFTQEN